MVRHHYGPWDKRYYHVLAYLEGRGLITVAKSGSAFQFQLTSAGKEAADALKEKVSFARLVQQMKAVKKELGPLAALTQENYLPSLPRGSCG